MFTSLHEINMNPAFAPIGYEQQFKNRIKNDIIYMIKKELDKWDTTKHKSIKAICKVSPFINVMYNSTDIDIQGAMSDLQEYTLCESRGIQVFTRDSVKPATYGYKSHNHDTATTRTLIKDAWVSHICYEKEIDLDTLVKLFISSF